MAGRLGRSQPDQDTDVITPAVLETLTNLLTSGCGAWQVRACGAAKAAGKPSAGRAARAGYRQFR
jgi:hypothetical protein